MGAYCTPFPGEAKREFIARCCSTAVKSGRNPHHALRSCEEVWEKTEGAEANKGQWTPNQGESRDDFVSRCMDAKMREGIDQTMAAGACFDMWNAAKAEEAKAQALAEQEDESPIRIRDVPVARGVSLAEISEESTGIKTSDLPKSRSFQDWG